MSKCSLASIKMASQSCLDVIDFILQVDERSAGGILFYNCCSDLAIQDYPGQMLFDENRCKVHIYSLNFYSMAERRGDSPSLKGDM